MTDLPSQTQLQLFTGHHARTAVLFVLTNIAAPVLPCMSASGWRLVGTGALIRFASCADIMCVMCCSG